MHHYAAATEELAQLRRREAEVEAALRDAETEEARLDAEIAKVDAQAGYYDLLAGEMKRDLQPPSLSGLVRSFRR